MEETVITRIETIVFLRHEPDADPGEWERGLMINEGQLFLDKHGKVVDEVYEYRRRSALVVETNFFEGKE